MTTDFRSSSLPILALAVGLLSVVPPVAAAPKTGAGSEKAPAKSAKKGSDIPSKNDPEAVELLRAIEARHGSMQSVAGRFMQSKRVADSPEEIRTVAEFALVKPNKFRADYLKPGQSPAKSGYPYITTNLIVGRDSWQFVRDLKQVSHYKFSDDRNVRDLNYLLLGFGAHTEELLKVYRVRKLAENPKGYRGVQLIPLDRSEAGFKYITLLVTDDEQLVPSQFSLMHSDESRVTVDLDRNSLKLGARVSDKTFKPDFPSDAEAVELN